MNLTPRQKTIVDFIRQYRKEHQNVSPTYAEIATAMGVSTVTIHEHIHALAAKGVVSFDARQVRSLRLNDEETLLDRAVQRLASVLNVPATQVLAELRGEAVVVGA